MTLHLSQLIQILILPPGFNLICGLTGAILLRFKPAIGKLLIAISFVSLWLMSSPLISQFLIDSLQNRYPTLDRNKLTKNNQHTAIVILDADANVQQPETGRLLVSDITLTRLSYGAFIHKRTSTPILVSGNNLQESSLDESEGMAAALFDYFGVTAKWKENQGNNTAMEAILVSEILRKFGISQIYLVTSAYHMPRALYAFKHKGLEVIPAPTGYLCAPKNFGPFSAILPTIDSLRVSSIAIREYIGIIWYHAYYR